MEGMLLWSNYLLNSLILIFCYRNSPLFCDKNHPQDLLITSPWGIISTQIQPERSARRLLSDGNFIDLLSRRLMQGGDYNTPGMTQSTPENGAASIGLSLPAKSAISTDYDQDQTLKGPPLEGAAGTYNYLIDAILSIPVTRAMYVRRLRTLMDEFLPTKKLEAIVTEEYQLIEEEVKRDVEFWGNRANPEIGYRYVMLL